jgi:cephalosporin-C deacetylase
MPYFDLPLVDLERYRPKIMRPADFEQFWQDTLDRVHEHPLAARFSKVDGPLTTVDVHDASFAGWGGDRIKAWFMVPRQLPEPVPCVMQFMGYGAGRGFPHQWLTWVAAGYATFVIDNRGQGTFGGYPGDTADPEGGGVNLDGNLTRGILDPNSYYYRRLYSDAVRAIEAAASHPAVDATRIVVAGASQGGGIALAAASLSPHIAAALIDVPFLSHFRRATEVSPDSPYNEIAALVRAHPWHEEQIFATLSYFDGANLAPQAKVPALFSVCLMDTVCPPSTVFASYNAWAGEKSIEIYPFGKHDAGGPVQITKQYEFLNAVLGKR